MVQFNKKERIIFWVGSLTGIVGGIIGGLWVDSYAHLRDNLGDWISWTGFIIFSLLFLALIFWIKSQLDKAGNIKRGRPKKIK